MIDTAQAYQNEGGVGRAIQKSGIKREDVFVVDKIWFSQYAGNSATKSIEGSLRKLGIDYIYGCHPRGQPNAERGTIGW